MPISAAEVWVAAVAWVKEWVAAVVVEGDKEAEAARAVAVEWDKEEEAARAVAVEAGVKRRGSRLLPALIRSRLSVY
jgi:hypothetical protein